MRGLRSLGLVAVLLGTGACGGDDDGPTTVEGMTVDVFGNDVTTYVKLDGDTVTEVGITLPVAAAEAGVDQPAGTFEGFGFNFPAEASTTVFNHQLLEFTTDGIGAPWDQPFFLMHFYFADSATRLEVGCPQGDVASDKLPSQYMLLPGTEFPNGGCVAGEGRHAADASAAEMQDPPGDFTHSMWIGYSDGELAFLEPFVTADYLINGADFSVSVREPATMPGSADGLLFPGTFSGTNVDGVWSLAFTDFAAAGE